MTDFLLNKEKIIERIKRYRNRMKYKLTPLTDLRYKPRKVVEYCERFSRSRTDEKAICFECHKIYNFFDNTDDSKRKCICNSTNIIRIGPVARLPRKNASKKKWDEFWKHCGKTCCR